MGTQRKKRSATSHLGKARKRRRTAKRAAKIGSEEIPKWLRDYQEMFPVQPPASLKPTPDSFKIPRKSFDIPDFGSSRINKPC